MHSCYLVGLLVRIKLCSVPRHTPAGRSSADAWRIVAAAGWNFRVSSEAAAAVSADSMVDIRARAACASRAPSGEKRALVTSDQISRW